MILGKPLKGRENTNIQDIIEVQGIYGIASIKPITHEEWLKLPIEYRKKWLQI